MRPARPGDFNEAVPSALTEIVIESADPEAAADFWSAALRWQRREHQPGPVPWVSASGDPHAHDLKLVFVPARPGSDAGTRLYLNPVGASFEQELRRLCSLGAQREQRTTGSPWVALVDPGGTGFTLLPDPIG